MNNPAPVDGQDGPEAEVLPELPLEVWERIATFMTSKEWARVSSTCRSWACLQPAAITISFEKEENVRPWLYKHWSKAQAVDLQLHLSMTSTSEIPWPGSASSKRFGLPELRSLQISEGSGSSGDFTNWAITLLSCASGLDTLHLTFRRTAPVALCMLPTLANLKHVLLAFRNMKALKNGDCRLDHNVGHVLEGLPVVETLHLSAVCHLGKVFTLASLDLSESRVQALTFSELVPEGLVLPPSCTLSIEGNVHVLARAWESVGRWITSCSLHVHDSESNRGDSIVKSSLSWPGAVKLASLYIFGTSVWDGRLPALLSGEQFVNLQMVSIQVQKVTLSLADLARVRILVIQAGELQLFVGETGPSAATLRAMHISWKRLESDLQSVLVMLGVKGVNCGMGSTSVWYPEASRDIHRLRDSVGQLIDVDCQCGACMKCLNVCGRFPHMRAL